jgi:hypothetical protein
VRSTAVPWRAATATASYIRHHILRHRTIRHRTIRHRIILILDSARAGRPNTLLARGSGLPFAEHQARQMELMTRWPAQPDAAEAGTVGRAAPRTAQHSAL